MLTKNIKLKLFRKKNLNLKLKKKLINLINEETFLIKSLKKEYKNSFSKKSLNKFKSFINYRIIGMGGSSLGTQAIYDFLSTKVKKNFEFVINNFPNTQYALDSEFKIDLIDDILASKEMYIGRYYIQKKKWIPAISRFRNVVDTYETTIYVEEALHRLVEVYYILGLEEESKKYANLLGYNYKSSEWYENSYSLFDENYKKIKIQKEKSGILNKFKSLFK